jgi:2-haloacid dehalogenase
MKLEALLFDVFGTCVDWRTGVATAIARTAAAKSLDIDSYAFADAWRDKYQPAMDEIRSGRRQYTDLDVLHRENLDKTITEFGVESHLDEEDREHLNRVWEQLPPWPDTVPALQRLKERFIIAPCSNGSVALMTRLAKFGNLAWDCILGAGIARAYKPDPLAYLRSCEALQIAPENVGMVAAHDDDLAAARNAGLKCIFAARPLEYGDMQSEDTQPAQNWEIIADGLEDAAAKLFALQHFS